MAQIPVTLNELDVTTDKMCRAVPMHLQSFLFNGATA